MAQLSYMYDAMGRRTSKAVQSGTPTQFLYDGANAVQEVQGSTVNSILTGLGVDERFARNDATGRAYFLTDALKSTIALTDPTGAIREQYSYGRASIRFRPKWTLQPLDGWGTFYALANSYPCV